MKYFARQASSFAAPVFFCLILPYLLVKPRYDEAGMIFNPVPFLAILGGLVCLVGLVAFILAVRMLIQIGRGTIMPWDPTRRLVTGSLYAYVRNPMIMSVLAIVAGEALLFGSEWLGLAAALFFGVNHVYFIFSEEPGLEKRFGQEYVEYKRNVPRWIPRLKPWHPN